jgi:hypothetical protein
VYLQKKKSGNETRKKCRYMQAGKGKGKNVDKKKKKCTYPLCRYISDSPRNLLLRVHKEKKKTSEGYLQKITDTPTAEMKSNLVVSTNNRVRKIAIEKESTTITSNPIAVIGLSESGERGTSAEPTRNNQS